MPSCIIETARLELVPFEAGHAEFLQGLSADPAVRLFLWDDQSITLEDAAEIVEASVASFSERGFGFWVIRELTSSKPVGFVGLREFGTGADVEILYALSPTWWGKGCATEASQAVLNFAFTCCDLPEVYAGCDPPNVASVRVMERLGMAFDSRRTIDGVESIYYCLKRDSGGPG